MCSCKDVNTVINNINNGKRNADIVWQSVRIPLNRNKFDTFFVTQVFILTIYNDTLKVLSTISLNHLRRRGRMVKGAGLVSERRKMLVVQILLETYIFILNFCSLHGPHSSTKSVQIKIDLHLE